jgi:hypothetical protein
MKPVPVVLPVTRYQCISSQLQISRQLLTYYISFYNFCPKVAPSQITFFDELIDINAVPPCISSLEEMDCSSSLGFPAPGLAKNASWVDPSNLPANGTELLSNLPGSVTAPISGTSVVWSLGTITAIASADSTVMSGEDLESVTVTAVSGKDTKTFINIKVTERAGLTGVGEEGIASPVRIGGDATQTATVAPGVYSAGVYTRAKYELWRLVTLFLSAIIVMV